MTTLPSFVELMASLGLENTTDSSDSHSLNRHSRSSSYSSTSSVVSQSSSDAPQPLVNNAPAQSPAIVVCDSPSRDLELERRRPRKHSPGRYYPYTPAISHMRRGSLPSNVKEEEAEVTLDKSGSSSPRHSSSRSSSRRSSLAGSKRPQKELSLDSDLIANTPISTFLRRKTPQSSPISPIFQHRKRSSSPTLPVSLPVLPSFAFPHSPLIATNSLSSDDDDEMMSDDSLPVPETVNRRRKVVSRPRSSSRLSEPDLPRRKRQGRRHRFEPSLDT